MRSIISEIKQANRQKDTDSQLCICFTHFVQKHLNVYTAGILCLFN
jgi:hypothetical protein